MFEKYFQKRCCTFFSVASAKHQKGWLREFEKVMQTPGAVKLFPTAAFEKSHNSFTIQCLIIYKVNYALCIALIYFSDLKTVH